MKHFHCPLTDWDCPYFLEETLIDGKKERAVCGMTFDKLNPYRECDDFYYAFGDDMDESDYTDYGKED